MRPLKFLILIISAAAGGCATLTALSDSAPITAVVSTPPGALVTVEGYGTCETPCTISLDAPRIISIAKAGFKPQRFQIRPGAKRVAVELELAAPTTKVESGALPDL
ncbi:MAG: PEGA domain-containing protein [Amphiplicatus sp.]